VRLVGYLKRLIPVVISRANLV